VPVPDTPDGGGGLISFTQISAGDAWGVNRYLIHYTDPCTAPTPTPGTPTATPTIGTPTSTPEPPRCPAERFTDVCPTDYFYQHVLDLNDLGVLTGYNTAPPCDGPLHIPCFKPYNWTTRGQVAKVVSLAAGFNEPVTFQMFDDVPPGHTFYAYIQRMADRLIIVGYPCGSLGEPCVPPYNLPYFRPGNPVTRGQLSKMATLSFGFNEPVSGQAFEDVPPGHTFYTEIERLAGRGIINGYPCGAPGEPCMPPENRPYFRPGNNITRGQVAKIVNLARIQALPTATPAATGTATLAVTHTPTATPTTNIPTATPTCCTDVTGSITATCQPTPYTVSYTVTNSCPITLTANIASSFQVSPNKNGPWQTLYIGDCFSCPVPPGTTQRTMAVYFSPLPPGNNFWRYHVGYFGTSCSWSLILNTDPQPACMTGTATPTPTTLRRP
jgi:S-layer homology domain